MASVIAHVPNRLVIFLCLSICYPFSSCTPDTLAEGSSLSVEKPNDVLTSRDGMFTAGFIPAGDNAFCFGIWFSEPSYNDHNKAVVWMANRNKPINGRRSELTLLKTGELILTDAGRTTVWSTSTASSESTQLRLYDTGNLVLLSSEGVVLWQSFDWPTDTLLTEQPLTGSAKLESSRSSTNFSSGFYKLFFDKNNVLTLLYDGIETSSVYWPYPWLISVDAGRSTYNSSKIAVLDSLGNFSSSDDFTFMSADYGTRTQRRLKVDYDGNLRLYSRKKAGESWVLSWEAYPRTCNIHGICGANSICNYFPSGRECSCVPGYKMRNQSDWSYGCEPQFNLSSCPQNDSQFFPLHSVEYYGYDYGFFPNYSISQCQHLCLQLCNCVGFQFTFYPENGYSNCYPKTMLLNGYRAASFPGTLYLRLPKDFLLSDHNYYNTAAALNCSGQEIILLPRTYSKGHANGPVQFLLWFACGLGAFEVVCFLLVWYLLIRTRRNCSNSDGVGGYFLAATGFRRYSFAELHKATKGFSEEIGRGAGGIVYRGVLPDARVAAIKRLNEANPVEAEFLAEVNTIGRLNHMHLIEMWGYCAEGKHRLLVYEYLEKGSLKLNLSSDVLDWEKRFEIAVGIAKGLAYLHEECLEWVLHCDVKPQNILLDSNYQPKIADFGMSKLLKREELNNSSLSRIRGTRGYMAPEWISNLPITSKVDVYSYGLVVLEMLTGKSPTCDVRVVNGPDDTEHEELVSWARRKAIGTSEMGSRVEEIMDPSAKGEVDMKKIEILLGVALKCVEEDKDKRPTMSLVLETLLHHEQ